MTREWTCPMCGAKKAPKAVNCEHDRGTARPDPLPVLAVIGAIVAFFLALSTRGGLPLFLEAALLTVPTFLLLCILAYGPVQS